VLAAALVGVLGARHAQPAAADVDGNGPAANEPLQEITVIAERMGLIGTARTASEGVIVNDELTLIPAFRPGQVLETVPGLDVATHSGEGKANQYLMRGYNLDHGTDLALFVDDMPVNEPSHAHGQGYADINFMIPELATNVSYTKGTYYADEGDFASVGSVHIQYLDRVPTQLTATVGTLGFQRLLSIGSSALGAGTLLGALEVQHYDGPWSPPGDQQKQNGVLRFSTGEGRQGYSVTAMLYHDTWNAQTDQPERALREGLLPSVYAVLDPSDAGKAERASLSGVFHQVAGNGLWSGSVYLISNQLNLWNNFTHLLVDPMQGDQEQQHEDRVTAGADTRFDWNAPLLNAETAWTGGLHTRFDVNEVSRVPSQGGAALTSAELAAASYPPNFYERDHVDLTSIAVYVQITSHWSDALRSVLGVREDFLHGVDSGTHAGSASGTLFQPKASLIYRLAPSSEVYASAGRGFHSNDLRGVDQARTTGSAGAPLIARQTGEEVGIRQHVLGDRVIATLALYHLEAESETTYNPDVGQDIAGPGSHRSGYELNVTYQVTRWLEIYGSYSGNHARYTSAYDDGSGHLGTYLPNAPTATASLDVYVRNLGPWSGGLAYRYLSGFPLSSGPCADAAVRADFSGLTSCALAPTPQGQVWGSGYGEWSAEVHYAWTNGWSIGLAGYNLLDKKADAMQFFYVDRLAGEAPFGVADVHFHPLEPLSGRLTISRRF
jgi:outer membrane receptor protein involved in Fe transport